MAALDRCNGRYGRGAVVVAAVCLAPARRGWATKFEMSSPRYLTCLAELPVVGTA